jgi:hypothetical protein
MNVSKQLKSSQSSPISAGLPSHPQNEGGRSVPGRADEAIFIEQINDN